ncbi:MAG TPA: hypothetical protein DD381_01145, partial [Lentisphaeria bacterium]|nr:hypothetical protein [Lentisphaeria bacterium]
SGNIGWVKNDLFEGGKGDDYLEGSYGSDTYIYNRGDGNDVLVEYNRAGVDTDTVKFGEGIKESDLFIERKNNDLLVTINDNGGSIRLPDYFVNGERRISVFSFADGTNMDLNQINSAVSKYGTDGNDTMEGDANSNTLYGGKGNDTISGKEGNDKLSGGSGSDVIDGGNGFDTALFEGSLSDYKVLNSNGKQYVFKQNTSGNEIDSLLNIESLKFADQTQSGDYSNFTGTDTLKYIATYQEMINQYGVSDVNGDWTQSINGANKEFVSEGYKQGLGSFDAMGYMTEHKSEIESVFGQGQATEENGLKHYISKKKENN